MIVIGLRGLQIEKHAQEVMAYCGQLAKDFARFREDFDVVGKHIGNAQGQVRRRAAAARPVRDAARAGRRTKTPSSSGHGAIQVGEQLRAIDAA